MSHGHVNTMGNCSMQNNNYIMVISRKCTATTEKSVQGNTRKNNGRKNNGRNRK